MRKILVLRGGALGDFVVTLPALAALRGRWPEARIELAGNATAAQLARNRGLVDAVHSQHEARWSALFGPAPLPREFREWLAEFDLVVNFWPDPEGDLARHLPATGIQQFISAPAMPQVAPASAHYCAALRALGIETAEHAYRLRALPTADIPSATPAPIYVHPGSGSPRKNWPRGRWQTLMATLPQPLALVLGAAERDAWRDPVANESFRLLECPLETLVAHFTRARLFLGHDSGISHLAAACGARCVLLFGPTAAAMWAPPVPNVRVIQPGPDLASLSVDHVASAVSAALQDRT